MDRSRRCCRMSRYLSPRTTSERWPSEHLIIRSSGYLNKVGASGQIIQMPLAKGKDD